MFKRIIQVAVCGVALVVGLSTTMADTRFYDAHGRYYDEHGRYEGRVTTNSRHYDEHGRYEGRVQTVVSMTSTVDIWGELNK